MEHNYLSLQKQLKVKEYLDIKAIKKLADEADELGYFEFDLQGGELLLQPKNYLKFSKPFDLKDFICILQLMDII